VVFLPVGAVDLTMDRTDADRADVDVDDS